jgi:hypothetical protein
VESVSALRSLPPERLKRRFESGARGFASKLLVSSDDSSRPERRRSKLIEPPDPQQQFICDLDASLDAQIIEEILIYPFSRNFVEPCLDKACAAMA